MFEGMGITYLGPVDGHDIEKLIKIFKVAKRIDHAVLVHVVTQKGHGYRPAERNPSKYHGIAPFDIKTGNVLKTRMAKVIRKFFQRRSVSWQRRMQRLRQLRRRCRTERVLPSFHGGIRNAF